MIYEKTEEEQEEQEETHTIATVNVNRALKSVVEKISGYYPLTLRQATCFIRENAVEILETYIERISSEPRLKQTRQSLENAFDETESPFEYRSEAQRQGQPLNSCRAFLGTHEDDKEDIRVPSVWRDTLHEFLDCLFYLVEEDSGEVVKIAKYLWTKKKNPFCQHD